MFFTSGQHPSEIGDFEMVELDGQLHCFYLALPSHDQIGHLVSEDGINWTQLPAAIRTGEPDEFDGDQIWTMGVYRHHDTWFMLYTALSQGGLMQRVGLATSPDLLRWEKSPDNPVISADARWYEAEQTGLYRVDWRDPHVVWHDGKLHGFICARRNEGLLNRRGCAGYFTSEDGYVWEVQPPACTPSSHFDFECPSVFELGGRFYMVAIAGGHDRQVYRVADAIAGPYRRPLDDALLPSGNLSVRPCLWRGQVHLFHWQRGVRDWGPSAGGGYAMLASPKKVSCTPDGSLVVDGFDWSAQVAAPAVELTEQTPALASVGQWHWSGGHLNAREDNGPAIWLTRDEHEDFVFQADFQLDAQNPAREFGLALRCDETGDCGLFASCVPGRYAVELLRYVHNEVRGPQSLWRGRTVKQTHHFTPDPDGRYTLRVVAFGPSLELSINGRLVLATMSMPRRRGRLGLFLEDGRGQFSNVTVQTLKAPNCHWEY